MDYEFVELLIIDEVVFNEVCDLMQNDRISFDQAEKFLKCCVLIESVQLIRVSVVSDFSELIFEVFLIFEELLVF